MKRTFTLIIVFISFVSFKISAQSDSLKNAGLGIKINISSYKFPGLQFETKLHKRKYVHLEAMYRKRNDENNFSNKHDILSEIHLFGDLRFYISKKGPFEGYFLAPSLSLSYLRNQWFETKQQEEEIYDNKSFYLGGGLTTGYQFLLKERILIDLYLGLMMQKKIIDKQEIGSEWNGISDTLGNWRGVPRAGLSLGYRFGKK